MVQEWQPHGKTIRSLTLKFEGPHCFLKCFSCNTFRLMSLRNFKQRLSFLVELIRAHFFEYNNMKIFKSNNLFIRISQIQKLLDLIDLKKYLI